MMSLQCLTIAEFISGCETRDDREHVDGGQRYIIVPSPSDVIERDGYIVSWEIVTSDAGRVFLMVRSCHNFL